MRISRLAEPISCRLNFECEFTDQQTVIQLVPSISFNILKSYEFFLNRISTKTLRTNSNNVLALFEIDRFAIITNLTVLPNANFPNGSASFSRRLPEYFNYCAVAVELNDNRSTMNIDLAEKHKVKCQTICEKTARIYFVNSSTVLLAPLGAVSSISLKKKKKCAPLLRNGIRGAHFKTGRLSKFILGVLFEVFIY